MKDLLSSNSKNSVPNLCEMCGRLKQKHYTTDSECSDHNTNCKTTSSGSAKDGKIRRGSRINIRESSDVIQKIFTYLTFREMSNMTGVCRYWRSLCDTPFYHRQVQMRWQFEHIDFGMGCGEKLKPMSDIQKWKLHILSREMFQIHFSRLCDPHSQIQCILQISDRYSDETIFQIEGWRWIIEIYDRIMIKNPRQLFETPECSINYIINCLSTLRQNVYDSTIVLLAAKTLGILSIHEKNRQMIGKTDGLQSILTAMHLHNDNTKVLSNLLWSLVILGRPLGGIEGEAYVHRGESNFGNVTVLKQLGCFDTVLQLCTTHRNNASILSKSFWLMVNLSLLDQIKSYIIRNNGVAIICNAMSQFPNNKELQYRAIFSLINVCIKRSAKQEMLKLNGVQLILSAMDRFKDCYFFQKCCTNVIRSLCADNNGLCNVVIENGGIERLRLILDRFSDRSELYQLSLSTIEYLESI